MDKKDQENLKFLLSTNNKQLQFWVESVSNEEINYALDILSMAKIELIDQEIDLVGDLSIAIELLDKYTLFFKGKKGN